MSRLLIIGFGNPLRSDDAVGWHLARRLSAELTNRDVEVIAAHQLLPEMAEDVSRAERVLFIDAATEGKPGTVRCERVSPAVAGRADTHQLSPAVILRMEQELYGRCPSAFLLTVTGECFETGDKMSDAVSSALPALLAEVRHFVEGRGSYQGAPSASTHEDGL